MKRITLGGILVLVAAAPWLAGSVTAQPAQSQLAQSQLAQSQPAQSSAKAPTFSADVAPIMYSKCVSCHRPGEVAPMSLITFRDVRPWAAAIRDKVASRAM